MKVAIKISLAKIWGFSLAENKERNKPMLAAGKIRNDKKYKDRVEGI